MSQWGRYAIVDTAEASPSRGKILLLLDDEGVALEIASELQTRGLDVAIEIRRQAPKTNQVVDTRPRGNEATISRLRFPVAGV